MAARPPAAPGAQEPNWESTARDAADRARLLAAPLPPAQVRKNFAAGRRLIVLVNFTGRMWHFGQQGASYAQERLLASIFGCRVVVADFWQPAAGDAAFVAALRQAALVVANAEGTLHHRVTHLHATLEAVAARRRRLPLWLINASFQFNMSTALGARSTPALFAGAAHAAVRDGMSYSALRAALPWAPVHQAADLTLLLPSAFSQAAAAQLGAERPGAAPRGAALRVVLSASSLGAKDYPAFWRELVPLVLEQHPDATFILALDTKQGAELAQALPVARVEALDTYASMAEVLWVLRHADVYIGGRFHAATYAYLAGLPAVLLPGNTWKVQAWAAMASTPGVDFVAQGVAAGAAEVWRRAQAAMLQRGSLGQRNLAALKQLALRNFPLASPAPLADTVTAAELRMQKAWMTFSRGKRRQAQLCERLGCCSR